MDEILHPGGMIPLHIPTNSGFPWFPTGAKWILSIHSTLDSAKNPNFEVPALLRAGRQPVVALAAGHPAAQLQAVQQVCVEEPRQGIDEDPQQAPDVHAAWVMVMVKVMFFFSLGYLAVEVIRFKL